MKNSEATQYEKKKAEVICHQENGNREDEFEKRVLHLLSIVSMLCCNISVV